MATSFCTAISTFIILWLIGLLALAVAASAIFLFVLGAVDSTTALPVAFSLICFALSWTYLILQSVITFHTKNRRSNYQLSKSRLITACIHLPRVLIVAWVAAATVDLVVGLRQSSSVKSDVRNDTQAWQAGFACWVFRVLASLNVVMVILSLSMFCLLESNGRYMPHGLFHFEHTASTRQVRRRTLLESVYGATDDDHNRSTRQSFEIFNDSTTINTEDGMSIIQSLNQSEQEKRLTGLHSTISPSPTYRTIDTNAGPYHSTHNLNANLTALHEVSNLDLTSLDGSAPSTFPSRSTTAATTTPLRIFTQAQLHSRPIFDIPNLPTNLQAHIKELQDLRNGTIRTIDTSTSSTTPTTIAPGLTLQTRRQALREITNTTSTPFKSSCALPLQHSTTLTTLTKAHHRHSSSTTTFPHDFTPRPESTVQRPFSVDRNGWRRSTYSATRIEHPAPAWCPNSLVQQPLSADPAIKRLTEAWECNRRDSMQRQLSCFDFDFANNATKPALSPTRNNTTQNTPNTQADKPALPHPTTTDEKENIPLPLSLPLSLSPSIHRQRSATLNTHDPKINPNTNTNKTRIQRVGTGLSIIPRIPPPDIPRRAPGHGVQRGRGRSVAGSVESENGRGGNGDMRVRRRSTSVKGDGRGEGLPR